MKTRTQLAAAVALLAALVVYAVGVEAQVVPAPFTSRLFTSTAPSGSNGFACRTTGCRVDLGTGLLDYLVSDGTNVTTGGAIVAGSNVTATAGGTGAMYAAQFTLAVASALPTCAAIYEGAIRRLTGTGGTNTLTRTRLCLCTSDGAASPAYAWQNVVTGTIGTTTTCSP